MGREIEELIPVLLSVDPVPEIPVSAPDAVHWTARAHEGSVYLFLVNDSRSTVSGSVSLPDRPRRVTLGDREAPVGDDGVLTVEIEPLGVQIYRIGR